MKIKKQEDIRDCGISVLQAFHNYFYNRWININDFKKKASYGLKGINIEGLCEVSESFGMKLIPMKGEFEALKELKTTKPIIALIGNEEENHYVIIEKIRKDSFKVLDPMTGQVENISFEKFQFQFLDVIIHVQKTSYSHKNVKVNSMYEYLFEFKTTIPWILISIVISIIVLFSSSFFMKIIMDQIIPGALNKTLIILFVGFVLISVLGSLNAGFKNFIIYKMYLHISMEITQKFNNKIKNTELLKIEKLTRSDIIRRTSFIEPISLFISSTVFSLTTEALVCLVASSILIWISVKLFLISVIVVVILLIVTFVSQRIINAKYGVFIKKQLDYSSINLDSLEMNKQLRKPSMKQFFLIKQSDTLYQFKKIDKKIWITNNVYGVVQNILMNVAPLLITLLATQYVIKDRITIGSLILYISMFHFFVNPITSITNVFMKYPLIKKEMDMLQYVLDLKNEKINPKGKKIQKINTITLKDIVFAYETGKPILNIKKLLIDENIILRGPNGSGKTTLLDIVVTNYQVPGVYFNNLETKYYNLNSIRDSVFRVNPSDHLPNATIIDFITAGDIKRYEYFFENYKRYKLHSIVEEMGLSLNKKMLNNASNLSSGQRQLVQLLRLFSQKYELIILDEAFENIESKLCKKIIIAIRKCKEKALFIEISHNNIFVNEGKEVSVESFKQN
ncbi:Mbov_0121 family peptidase domain-containing ABC transporter [Mycoplasma todarodis]|uniref:Mbov_0121 family peptidase domain-containing ABC transporter n=1 Tax=Mycoplasma todarodis TaxID=1937191 RepID=UPI003B333667